MNVVFWINSILLGIGLAMDAFSVSLANGLRDPAMKKGQMRRIAGVFAFFQGLMPLIGWIAVHTVLTYFQVFETYVPWIALALLWIIGGKMLYEGIFEKADEAQESSVGMTTLLVQGIATSIDALSVGFAIADYALGKAVVCVWIIATVTFLICMIGLLIGKKFGTQFAGRANILGGLILMMIGLEIIAGGKSF